MCPNTWAIKEYKNGRFNKWEENWEIRVGSWIIISSIGESSYDGWYNDFVFGLYSYHSRDARGNVLYYASIKGKDRFIFKTSDGNWMVGVRTDIKKYV